MIPVSFLFSYARILTNMDIKGIKGTHTSIQPLHIKLDQ